MSLKLHISEINDLARVVPADMEIATFTGILCWAAAVMDERAAAEPSEPMSLPREAEAAGSGDGDFCLVEADEPVALPAIVEELAAHAGIENVAAEPAPTVEPDHVDAEAEPASPAEAEDAVADPAPLVPPPAIAADAPDRATSPLGVIWSKADDKRLVEMWDAGSSDAAIAAELQRSARAIQNRLARLRKSGEFGPLAVRKLSPPVPVPKPAPQLKTKAAATTTESTSSAAPSIIPPTASRLPAAARAIYEHLKTLNDDFTAEDDLFLVEQAASGVSLQQICDQLGCEMAAGKARLHAMRIPAIMARDGRMLSIDGQAALLAALRARAGAA